MKTKRLKISPVNKIPVDDARYRSSTEEILSALSSFFETNIKDATRKTIYNRISKEIDVYVEMRFIPNGGR